MDMAGSRKCRRGTLQRCIIAVASAAVLQGNFGLAASQGSGGAIVPKESLIDIRGGWGGKRRHQHNPLHHDQGSGNGYNVATPLPTPPPAADGAPPTRQIVSTHGRDDGSDATVAGVKPPNSLQIFFRGCYLFLVFLLPLLTAPLAAVSAAFRDKVWYNILLTSISRSGAAFIKWGQWSSTRPDMFPERLCEALSKLHASAPTHGWKHTETLLQRAFRGRPIEEVFDWFPREPIASGSIAQVYKAVLNGQVVAIKVRHPHVKERIYMDFQIMQRIAIMCDNIPGLKWLNLKPSMEQFSHTMAAQTRLDIEAHHLDVFNHNFRKFRDCEFPKSVYSSEEVIVESFEEGGLISDYIKKYAAFKEQEAKGGLEKLRSGAGQKELEGVAKMDLDLAGYVVSRGEDMYLKMLLVDNLMHADLHPGNILLHTDPETHSRHLTLVDAGMVAKLEQQEADNFIGLLEAMGDGDGYKAGRIVLQFSEPQPCQGEQAEQFVGEMGRYFTDSCRGYNLGVEAGEVLRGVLAIVRKYQVRVDVNYATLLMNVLCLDGLAKALLPEYNILDGAKPLLEAHKMCKTPLGRAIFNTFLPVAQVAKGRRDRWFMNQLKAKQKQEARQAVAV